MSKKILVVGGTGMLGKPVAEHLAANEFDVTIMSSNPDKAKEIFSGNIDVVYGDVTNIESLKKPIEGQDFIHINVSAKLNPELYETIEIGGCDKISRVAKEIGVKRIGYISGASSHGEKRGVIYLDAKVEAENRIIDSGVPYSIFRASWFFESLPRFIQQGKAMVLGEQPIKFGWLAASDYAEQVRQAYCKEEAANKCFYNVGPEKLTMMEALERFCTVCYPELQPEVLSFGMAKMFSIMPGMEQLKLAIPFFEYFTDNNEDIDPTESNEILGLNKTSVEEWSQKYKAQM